MISTRQEIANCPYCDLHGKMANGYPCNHDDPQQRAARAKAHADLARAEIKPTVTPADRAQAALAQVRVTRTNALNEETQP